MGRIRHKVNFLLNTAGLNLEFFFKIHWGKFHGVVTNSIVFVYTQLNVKIVLFQAIQFSISTQFSSIWLIDRTLSDATTLSQSRPGSDGNEEVLRNPQNSSITGTSPSDCLVSYPGHSLVGCLTPLQRCNQHILRTQLIGQCTELIVKTVLFQIIQFSISTQFKCQNSTISRNQFSIRT